jgi:hypothetical protein
VSSSEDKGQGGKLQKVQHQASMPLCVKEGRKGAGGTSIESEMLIAVAQVSLDRDK